MLSVLIAVAAGVLAGYFSKEAFDSTGWGITSGIFAGLGILFGVALAIASRVFAVESDPRVEQVLDCLPGANCGGCGYSGCAALAQAIVKGEAKPNACNSCSAEGCRRIGEIMGIEVEISVPLHAHVMCSGNCHTAKYKYSYEGAQDYYEYSYYYIAAETVEGEDGSLAATDETKAEAEKTANAILDSYNALGVTEEEDDKAAEAQPMDIETRLNTALAENGVDADCISTRSSGESLGTYKDWIMSLPEAGEATVLSNDAGSGFYVVAFRAHDANEYNVANVRHILVQAVADENGEYTDEAKAEAKARAEELYNEWKSGEATEDSFAAMANEYSEDGGSNTKGGLYENVMRGQMVEEFDQFCFEGHKAGDTAIVYGESLSYAGYHIMYFVGEGENCRDYIARADLSTTDTQAWIDELVAGYEPVEKFWLKLAA